MVWMYETLNHDGINHDVNVKNMSEFSKDYSERGGLVFFTTQIQQLMLILINIQWDRLNMFEMMLMMVLKVELFLMVLMPIIMKDLQLRRKALLTTDAAARNNGILALNRFGFFISFFRSNSTKQWGKFWCEFWIWLLSSFCTSRFRCGQIYCYKLVLWVPKMIYNAKLHTRSHLKERIEISSSTKQRQGSLKPTSSIRKPRHVFIWAVDNNKLND